MKKILLALFMILITSCSLTSSPTSQITTTSNSPTTNSTTEPEPLSIGLIGSMEESCWTYEIEFTNNNSNEIWRLDNYPLYRHDEFKIVSNDEKMTQWGYDNFDELSKEIFLLGENNRAIVSISGYYSFSFNYYTEVVTITLDEEIIETPIGFENEVESSKKVHEFIKSGNMSFKEERPLDYYYNEMNYAYEFGEDKNGPFTYVEETTEWSTTYKNYYVQNSNGNWLSIYFEGEELKTKEIFGDENFEYGATVNLLNNMFKINGAQGLLEFIFDSLIKDIDGTSEFNNELGVYEVNATIPYITSSVEENRICDISASIIFYKNSKLKSIDVKFEEYNNVAKDLITGKWIKSANSINTNKTSISCKQEVGVRTIQNPINIDSYLYTSWDLATTYFNDDYEIVADEKIDPSQVITLANGISERFLLINTEPETADWNIDKIKFTIVEGREHGLEFYFNEYNGSITISSLISGDYVVEVSTINIKKRFSIKVIPSDVESVDGIVYFKDGTNYDVFICNRGGVTEFYNGSEFYLYGNVNPFSSLRDVTYEIISGEDIIETEFIKDWTYVNYIEPRDVLKIKSKGIGKIEIRITSVQDPTISSIFTFKFISPPELEDLLKYEYGAGRNTDLNTHVVFTPNINDPSIGTVLIGDKINYDWHLTYITYDYEYNYETKAFKLTTNGAEYIKNSLSFSEKYKLKWGSTTLSVLDKAFYFNNSYWSTPLDYLVDGKTVTRASILFDIYNNGIEGSFGFIVVDGNYNYTVSIELHVKFEIIETSDGYECIFEEETIEAIEATNEVSNLSIKWSSDVKTIKYEFNSVSYGYINFSKTF